LRKELPKIVENGVELFVAERADLLEDRRRVDRE
jgi:hypothetical protein